MSEIYTQTQNLVKSLYKDASGEPIILSPSQDIIFSSIAKKTNSRVHVMCHTRFGKSLTVGLSALTRVATYPEKWSIIAGTKEKAKIIMDYVIQHIFDNDYTEGRFTPEKGETVANIRRYRNKNRLNFRVGSAEDPATGKVVPLFGEIYIGAAKDALGFGAPNVIEDEAALISDADHSLVTRMLGDDVKTNFMVKIGNPFARNHFLNSFHDPKYQKIIVDCYQSLKEGRITQDLIDENKPYPYFGVLYECKFPSASDVDESGWLFLFTDKDIELAKKRTVEPFGEPCIGHDVARGGRNYNTWVFRQGNYAKVIAKDRSDNLIVTGDNTIKYAREYGVRPSKVYIDDTGVGGGETDYLKSLDFNVAPVKLGSTSEQEDMLNVRAEIYAGKDGLSVWLKTGGYLVDHTDWIEATAIRYRKNARGRLQLESKDDMRKRGIDSPDTVDALALTFAKVENNQYHGIDIQKVLEAGAPTPYGGVKPFAGV